MCLILTFFFFFCKDSPTPQLYTLSLHDALPISHPGRRDPGPGRGGLRREDHGRCRAAPEQGVPASRLGRLVDRKSTRLNSSHGYISYAVFCLKKKNRSQIFFFVST